MPPFAPLRLLAPLLLFLSACAAAPRDPKPDRAMKPEGDGWYCSAERSGMLSVCERTRQSCKRAKKFLRGLAHRRGDQMTLGPCKKRPKAYCLTAERLLPDQSAQDQSNADEAEESGESSESSESDESDESAESAESAEADQDDRLVIDDELWLCYANRDDCEWQRKNMYYFGFTHVSRCGSWK